MESSKNEGEDNLLAAYRLTNDDLALFAEGLAGDETSLRVTGAVLVEPAVCARLDLLRILDDAEAAWQEGETAALSGGAGDAAALDFHARAEALRERMAQITRFVAQEEAPESDAEAAVEGTLAAAYDASPERFAARFAALVRGQAGSGGSGGGLWRVAAQALEAAIAGLTQSNGGGYSTRALATGRQPLTLPCLAPAAAAPAADMTLRRQKVTTPDGVLIEFQQLPVSPHRLRLLIDASLLAEDFDTLGYNAAFVTLEETLPRDETASAAEESEELPLTYPPPDRHVLIVKLNRQGRGFTDFLIAADSGSPSVLPAPRGGCHLVGATLSRLPEEPAYDEEVFTASPP